MTTATAPTVHAFLAKSHDAPDERRTPDKTQVDVVRLDSFTIGRFTLQPGWRWSTCIKPVVKTETCQLPHVGYAVSGSITVKMNDGSQKTIRPGMSYTIPPGHEAWVEGKEPFVAIEVMSADIYAKPA
jgi:mannose-6-phosphate isomerase-like protein (cupin superfamily)